jgi:hypothetical protein
LHFTYFVGHSAQESPRRKGQAAKRIEKNSYDDKRPMEGRRFVREIY